MVPKFHSANSALVVGIWAAPGRAVDVCLRAPHISPQNPKTDCLHPIPAVSGQKPKKMVVSAFALTFFQPCGVSFLLFKCTRSPGMKDWRIITGEGSMGLNEAGLWEGRVSDSELRWSRGGWGDSKSHGGRARASSRVKASMAFLAAASAEPIRTGTQFFATTPEAQTASWVPFLNAPFTLKEVALGMRVPFFWCESCGYIGPPPLEPEGSCKIRSLAPRLSVHTYSATCRTVEPQALRELRLLGVRSSLS